MVAMGQRGWSKGYRGQEQGLALDLASPLAKVLLREVLVLGCDQDGGLWRVCRRDAEHQGWHPLPSP